MPVGADPTARIASGEGHAGERNDDEVLRSRWRGPSATPPSGVRPERCSIAVAHTRHHFGQPLSLEVVGRSLAGASAETVDPPG